MEPTHYQGMEVNMVNVCRGARYKNLWVLEDKKQKIDNNVQFYLYLDVLRDEEMKIPWITDAAVKKYKNIARLEMGPHVIHIEVW